MARREARRHGLKVAIHAGEVLSAEEVAGVLRFKPDRLGHMCDLVRVYPQCGKIVVPQVTDSWNGGVVFRSRVHRHRTLSRASARCQMWTAFPSKYAHRPTW